MDVIDVEEIILCVAYEGLIGSVVDQIIESMHGRPLVYLLSLVLLQHRKLVLQPKVGLIWSCVVVVVQIGPFRACSCAAVVS